MAESESRVPLIGSERRVIPGARALAQARPNDTICVTLVLRRHAQPEYYQEDQLPSERHYLSREEFAALHGAGSEDIVKVEAFADSHGSMS